MRRMSEGSVLEHGRQSAAFGRLPRIARGQDAHGHLLQREQMAVYAWQVQPWSGVLLQRKLKKKVWKAARMPASTLPRDCQFRDFYLPLHRRLQKPRLFI